MVFFRRFDPDIHHRRSTRLAGHDYCSPGAYFLTMHAAAHDDFFGTIENGMLILNDFGKIVQFTWHDLPNHNPHISLDAFVIMPNHVHGIIVIHDCNIVRAGSKPARGDDTTGKHHALPEIIRQFKTFSARRINALRGMTGKPVWQRNYYEHIIRKGDEINRIRQYIHNNPMVVGADSIVDAGSIVGAGSQPAHTSPNYVLQRINHTIFKDIPGLMENIVRVTDHIRDQLVPLRGYEASGDEGLGLAGSFMQVLQLVPALNGSFLYRDPDGNSWRLYHHLPGSHSYDRVPGPEFAYEGGRAFGSFQQLTAGLDPKSLYVTIPRFHDVTWRMEQFEEALGRDAIYRVSTLGSEISFVRDRSEEMLTIYRLMESGRLPERVTHNDTKFNNILFDANGRAVCIVDLDTVMPGSVLFDFGDAIRTGANTADEDEPDLGRVEFDLDLFEAYARGFMETAGSSLTPAETGHLAFSAKFMTYLIGLRFLTDHINGDTYYKIRYPGHNLQRARVQFRLLERMESRFPEMQSIILQHDRDGETS